MDAADTLIGAADPDVFGDRSPLEVLGTALWTLTEVLRSAFIHGVKRMPCTFTARA